MADPIKTYSLSEYKEKYSSTIEVIPSDNHDGIVFFACGTKKGKPNYGAIGSKAQQIVQDMSLSATDLERKLKVCTYEVIDDKTGEVKELDILQAKGGKSIRSI